MHPRPARIACAKDLQHQDSYAGTHLPTPQMDEGEAEQVCHSKDVVVIDEPSNWPGMVSWEAPKDEIFMKTSSENKAFREN